MRKRKKRLKTGLKAIKGMSFNAHRALKDELLKEVSWAKNLKFK